MTNKVALFKSAALPDVQSFQRSLAAVQDDLQISSGSNFLKLDKASGLWMYGAQENECQEGSEWAINPMSLKTGYIAWGKGEVLGKHVRSISQQPVIASELPPAGPQCKRGWEKCIVMTLVCLNGEDAGTQVEYEQTSYGARSAFSDLLGALQVQAASDPVNIVPVVTLESDSYEHKEYGKIHNPIFAIKRWMSMEGEATAAAPVPAAKVEAPKEEAAPATRRRRPAVA